MHLCLLLDILCDRLADAINTGDIDTAKELSELLAGQKTAVHIKLKNPKMIKVDDSGDSFRYCIICCQ